MMKGGLGRPHEAGAGNAGKHEKGSGTIGSD
jgi:hypothetical protein